MIKIKVNYFDLKETVTCGQIFRYYISDKGYDIVLKDRVINVYQKDNVLYLSSNNEDNLEKIVNSYFDLERDYRKINNELIKRDSNTKKYIDAS
ncbi:MAG TPA: DNA glycosylase, partial [Bacilli bacterium]|nr:DNA glycosylase [Bacilli bacterium]